MNKYRFLVVLTTIFLMGNCFMAAAEICAGISRVSINPINQGLKVQLGGYGERQGKPALGTHDETWAKILTLKNGNEYLFIITLDICHVPWCLVEHTIKKAELPFINQNNILMMSSHTHAGLEGMSIDERNIVNNPNIGIFDEEVLKYVSSQIAKGIQESIKNLSPVTFSAGRIATKGLNRNRRHEELPTDPYLTVLRFDKENKPWVIFINFTAHETIMTPNEMLLSAGYPGIIQRTIETFYPGTTCMFSNGAEGDVAPSGYKGTSAWESMENYGLNLAKLVIDIFKDLKPEPISLLKHDVLWKDLPPKKVAPDFFKIAGEEYNVSEEMVNAMINQLFPSKAPFHFIQINDCAIVTFPGEPITEIGMGVKQKLENQGIKIPVVTSLTNDLIGYILTEKEYQQSGYEVTASFYGPQLGEIVITTVDELIQRNK